MGKANGSNPVHELIPGLAQRIGISVAMAGSMHVVPGFLPLEGRRNSKIILVVARDFGSCFPKSSFEAVLRPDHVTDRASISVNPKPKRP